MSNTFNIDAIEASISSTDKLVAKLSGTELKDGFVTSVNVMGEEIQVPVVFTRWEDSGRFNGITVGVPYIANKPVRDYYAAQHAIGAVMTLQEWAWVDPSGALFWKTPASYAEADEGKSFGWVSSAYDGEEMLPSVRLRKDGPVVAVAELVKTLGVADTGFFAAKPRECYAAGDNGFNKWKKAQYVFDGFATTMAIAKRGGVEIQTGSGLEALVNYAHLLFNYREVDPEGAAEHSREAKRNARTRNRSHTNSVREMHREDTRVSNGNNPKPEVIEIANVEIVDGATYVIRNKEGAAMSARFVGGTKYCQAQLRNASNQLNDGAWHLVTVKTAEES